MWYLVYAFFWVGAQGAGGSLLGQPQAVRPAIPLKLVLFKVAVDALTAQRMQLVNVQLALADAPREYQAQFFQVGLFYTHGKSINLVVPANPLLSFLILLELRYQ